MSTTDALRQGLNQQIMTGLEGRLECQRCKWKGPEGLATGLYI